MFVKVLYVESIDCTSNTSEEVIVVDVEGEMVDAVEDMVKDENLDLMFVGQDL